MNFLIFALAMLLPCSAFAQVDAAILKVQSAMVRPVVLDLEAVDSSDLQRPDKDRATLTQDVAKAQKLYAECLRANTVVGKTADTRVMTGERYWDLIGNTGTNTDLIAILEKRSGRAKQVSSVIKRAIPVLEMEKDPAQRAIWLQRFAVLEESLRTISANPHNANGARFELKRHLGFFELKEPIVVKAK